MWFFNLVVDQNGDSIALTRAKEKTMSETVEIQIENHIATINLNRPDKKNAVDMEMFEKFVADFFESHPRTWRYTEWAQANRAPNGQMYDQAHAPSRRALRGRGW